MSFFCKFATELRPLLTSKFCSFMEKKIFNLLENYSVKILACSQVSDRCPFSYLSKIFSSETTWPIKAKFDAEPPWEGGTKLCTNGPGHMTKIAAMPIHGKNLHKSSSPEPVGRFPRNLVCIIEDSCPSEFVQMMTLE